MIPRLPADEKFDLRAQRIVKMLMDDESTNRAPMLAKAEKTTRELREEFPKREESNEILLMVAQGYLDTDVEKAARTITEDVVKKASGEGEGTGGGAASENQPAGQSRSI